MKMMGRSNPEYCDGYADALSHIAQRISGVVGLKPCNLEFELGRLVGAMEQERNSWLRDGTVKVKLKGES